MGYVRLVYRFHPTRTTAPSGRHRLTPDTDSTGLLAQDRLHIIAKIRLVEIRTISEETQIIRCGSVLEFNSWEKVRSRSILDAANLRRNYKKTETFARTGTTEV